MIAIDSNILVYAHRLDRPHSAKAHAKLTDLAEGSTPWGIPRPCVHEFLSVVTHPRIFDPPTPLAAALEQVDAWFASPGIAVLGEPNDYWARLRATVTNARVVGPKIHDAHIAAICLGHGVHELWSADRDFSRFPGLRVVNPLN